VIGLLNGKLIGNSIYQACAIIQVLKKELGLHAFIDCWG